MLRSEIASGFLVESHGEMNMFKDTVQWTITRQRASSRGAAQGQIALQLMISRKTLSKMLNLTSPTGNRPQPVRPLALGPWIAVIDRIVKENEMRPIGTQISAKLIWKYLCEDRGFKGSFAMINAYVRQARIIARLDAKPVSLHRGVELQAPPLAPQVFAPSIKVAITTSLRQSNRELERRTVSAMAFLPARSARNGVTEEHIVEWIRSLLKQAIPVDVMAKELSHVPLRQLEALLSAAAKEGLPMRNKAVAVLCRLRGINCAPVCSFLQISSGTWFRYWRLFQRGGTKMLFANKTRSDKKSEIDSNKSAVFALLHSPPAAYGINRTTWRMADLRTVLGREGHPMCCDVIHTIIKEAGWKWRHARVVLTSNDPDYRVKVDAIKKILSELTPDEAFFSIDEYGPFAIKQKGGLKRVAPGEQHVVQQWQKSKGWTILTAALELSRNRISHFYSRKKNTEEMIKMADLLRNEYRTYKTIYLSWDAASWHVSKDLGAYLEKINQDASADGYPIIKTAPLPASAQFLNVIESVFSGMAKAIIHNSDYVSVEAAMEAIDRYFGQRNEYFAAHPQKAGHKIWGEERVPSVFAEGHNCKDPMYQNLY
jgi:transposase